MKIKNITKRPFRASYLGNPSLLLAGAVTKKDYPIGLAFQPPVAKNLSDKIIDLILTSSERAVYDARTKEMKDIPLSYAQRMNKVFAATKGTKRGDLKGNNVQPATSDKGNDPSPWNSFLGTVKNIKPAGLVDYFKSIYEYNVVHGSQINDFIKRYMTENKMDATLIERTQEVKIANEYLATSTNLSPKEQSEAIVKERNGGLSNHELTMVTECVALERLGVRNLQPEFTDANRHLCDEEEVLRVMEILRVKHADAIAKQEETKEEVEATITVVPNETEEEVPSKSVSKMNKTELLSEAARRDLDFNPDMTKKELKDLIQA